MAYKQYRRIFWGRMRGVVTKNRMEIPQGIRTILEALRES